MDELVTFLRDRLDEDEAAAREAMDEITKASPGTEHPGEWKSGHIYLSDDGNPTGYEVWADDDPDTTVISADRPLGEHIARHSPARVLADVDAKRRISEQYEVAAKRLERLDERAASGVADERAMQERATEGIRVSALRPVLRLLTLPYADHPDHREEWRS